MFFDQKNDYYNNDNIFLSKNDYYNNNNIFI